MVPTIIPIYQQYKYFIYIPWHLYYLIINLKLIKKNYAMETTYTMRIRHMSWLRLIFPTEEVLIPISEIEQQNLVLACIYLLVNETKHCLKHNFILFWNNYILDILYCIANCHKLSIRIILIHFHITRRHQWIFQTSNFTHL